MKSDIVISITKDRIFINRIECTSENYEQVFINAGIGEHEAKAIIKLILDMRCKKWGGFMSEQRSLAFKYRRS